MTPSPVRLPHAARRRRSPSATTSRSPRSPPRDWDALVARRSRCCRMRSCPRCTRPAARRRATGWRRAISPRGAATRSSARCRSTRRRIRTASTCSTGPGPTPIAATAAATIRSSSRRFRSRRRRARGCSRATTRRARALLDAALAACCASRRSYSSLHVLFPTRERSARCATRAGMIDAPRRAVPLGEPRLSRLRRLPRRVQPRQAQEGEAGAAQGSPRPASRSRARSAREITPRRLGVLLRCYERTYRAHTRRRICRSSSSSGSARRCRSNLLLVVGARDGRPLCAALDVFDARTLWGRYWGAIEYVPGLHFEACYYQAIEFCIERGIARFEGGAQGVHKLARGLMPVTTYSAHAIADPDFAARDRRVLRARARRRRARRRRARGARARSATMTR